MKNDVLKALAGEMGFDAVGITRPSQLKEGEEAIQEWVKEGRHGSMKYLEDFMKRRNRFFEDFQDAKSVIVLGVNYYSSDKSQDTSHKISGRVARYAWGKDYHEVIRQKHETLIEKIRETVGNNFRAKSCVDIQPIPERFAAQQSGLGFVGKNTVLLNQKFGPWLFLSELITNLELDEDLADQGDCGTCSRCQKACPTGALDEDYKMDARRCIAYLTIEHKGAIPTEFRPHVKDWIFGCDDCLTSCPFTAKSKKTSWKEFEPDSGFGPSLEIKELFEIRSNSDYEKKFKGTALLRASRKQMLRNACLVLGNSGSPEALPYLEKAMQDPAPLVRSHAAWGIGRIGGEKAQQVLKEYFAKETDPTVKAEITAFL